MRTIPYILIGLMLIGGEAGAQSINSLRGSVFSIDTRKPLPFVTATLLDSSGVKIDATYTDSLGQFQFAPTTHTPHHLLITMAGFDSLRMAIPVKVENTAIEFDSIFLSRRTVSLKAVTVISRKPVVETKMDGIIYNAGSEVQMAGGSALDVLRRVPLLTVQSSGEISVSGSQSVAIYIDDRPAGIYSGNIADYLALLAGDRIDRVRVITNPSAKYEAEGAGAVVLIYTKKNLLNNLGGSARIGHNHGDFKQGSLLGTSLFYKLRRVSFFLAADYSTSNRYTSSELTRDYSFSDFNIRQAGFDTSRRKSFNGSIGADMEVDSMTSINLFSSFVSHRTRLNSSLENAIIEAGDERRYDRFSDRLAENQTGTLSLAFSRRFRQPEKELSFLSYFSNRNGGGNYTLIQTEQGAPVYTEDYESDGNTREWSFQLDYGQAIRGWGKWEAGSKAILRRITSEYAVLPKEATRSGDFLQHQNVYAAYLSNESKLGKWQARAGIRFEHTFVSSEFNNLPISIRPYSNLIPNILFSRSLGSRHQFTSSYSQSISRPSLFVLNPSITYLDSLNFTRGNPALRPQLNHRVDANITLRSKNGSFLRLTLYGFSSRNSILQIRRLSGNGVLETTWENIGIDRGIGYSTNWNQQITKKLKAIVVFNGSIQERRVSELGLHRTAGYIFASAYLLYTFKKGLAIDGYIMSQTPAIDIQNRSTVIFPQYYIFSVSKSLWKERLSASVTFESFFTSNQPFTTVTSNPDFRQTSINYISNNNINLRISYRFNQDLKENRSRARNKASQVPVE